MLEKGFVKIDRSITRWRWYQNANTFRVFFHLLMTANFDDRETGKLKIRRGERVGGRLILAAELGMSEQEVRTALQHLEETQEITIRKCAKYSVYTIKNYDKYQSSTRLSPENQPDTNQESTRYQPHNKKEQESKRKNKKRGEAAESYGEYGRVKLTQSQYRRLLAAYGEERTHAYIMQMDEWMQMKGKAPYKDYYLAIRRWIRKDQQEGKNTQQNLEERAYEQYKGTTVAEGFI